MRPIGWLALAACATALAACGSSSKSPSTTGTAAQAPAAPAQPTTPATTTSSTPTTTASAGNGGTAASTTRTATEPAFTSQPSSAEGVGAAIAAVRTAGFTPVNAADYHASQTLRVLIGSRSGASDAKKAFFFVDGRFIGTDASEPSAMVAVAAQGDTEVTLSYSLYNIADSLCCPGAGHANVTFQLNNGKLVALGAIPPVHSATRPSRR